MKKIGLFVNPSKKKAVNLAENLIRWLKENDYVVYTDKNVADKLGFPVEAKSLEELAKSIDLAITLGGDGTLLAIARKMAPHDIPVLGINLGHLGFLTEIEVPDLFRDFEQLKANKYNIERRMMIEAQVLRENKIMEKFLALNDVVITKGPFARLIRLKARVNDAYIDTYNADGLIISTPTGSTAYSLSAGGPIVNPNMELLLLTPICPHTLQNRSIIMSKDDVINVQILAEHQEIMLTVDGQQGYELLPNDKVIVKKSDFYTKLVRIKSRSFYDILRKKLRESNCQ
ncbi:NAD(+)/NADH kinase [Thermosediminibacter oceani]|uniref:NAD kinase n=1 Tax=Thermosediminibacter oceani (strain ATCC BAA-1034 / DSM 16646 / JW/IW-1228P) TaxID=555079 RepID=D9S3T2_THEOJ|nr:NAD(+)/NADH kinase [Thermosediminibacter oceani]ADL08059.1 ATP-NAD/AcoX kinase [Thermosediminibacter oceani DSM 16646]